MEVFKNQQININSLPRMQNIDYIKPKKAFLTLTLIKSIIFWLVLTGLFILTTIAARQEFPHLVPYAKYIFFPFAIFSLLLTLISYYKRGHALRDFDIIYKEGVLFNSVTTISFNRVQHCEISQGPLEQVFDLHTLKIFTAGGQSSDLEIPGLDEDSANGLKEYVVEATSNKASIKDNQNIIGEDLQNNFYNILPDTSYNKPLSSEEQ
jgi:membrane protein YdbS with pleckstrin-like domain